MAKSGTRFGDREKFQKGSSSTSTSKMNKSGNITNRNDKLPGLKENVGKGVKQDLNKIAKAARTNTQGAAKAAVKSSAARAASRLVGRAGAAGAALEAGWEAGKAIDKATGIGKKMVDATVGKAIDKAVTGEREGVKLSEEAKKRIAGGELNKKDERINKKDYPTYKSGTDSSAAFKKAFSEAKRDDQKTFTFEGRKYTTEEKKMAKGGMVKKAKKKK